MIKRILEEVIHKKLFTGKSIVLLGPRQSGKTTLLLSIVQKYKDFLFLDGDDPYIRQLLDTPNTEELKSIIGKHKIIFIDEVQRIQNSGLTMKIIHDQFKNVQLLASGSSALDIGNNLNEPLTGRKWEYLLLPVSWKEHVNHIGLLAANQQLEHRIIFGMYPDVINRPGEEREVLKLLTSSYLYKDILMLGGIKKPDVLEKLLQALALQIGNEVSYNELSRLLSIDKNTVSTYIDLLEKAFIIFRLNAYSKNLRNEIKTGKKIFFYDNGIRNAVINNFNMLDLRQDKGALWENFVISERIKTLQNNNIFSNLYFWRTRQQQEIDLIEEKNGEIYAYEIKWKKGKIKPPSAFINNYKSAKFEVIDRNNFQKLMD